MRSFLTQYRPIEPLTPFSGSTPTMSSSSIPKSAKTTERREKRARFGEHSEIKPERKLASSVQHKTQNSTSKSGRRKVVVVSADTVDDVSSSTTKPGDVSLTSEMEQEPSLPSSFKVIAGSY